MISFKSLAVHLLFLIRCIWLMKKKEHFKDDSLLLLLNTFVPEVQKICTSAMVGCQLVNTAKKYNSSGFLRMIRLHFFLLLSHLQTY